MDPIPLSSCFKGFDLLRSFIQFGLWPLTTLIVIRLFEDEIRELIPRLKKVGNTEWFPPSGQQGVSLIKEQSELGESLGPMTVKPPIAREGSPATAGVQGVAVGAESHRVSPESLMPKMRTPLLTEQEQIIQKQVENFSAEDKLKILISNCAAFRLSAEFENVYGLIFGGQLKILEMLNIAGDRGEEEVALKPMFSEAAKNFPLVFKESGFGSYVGFLAQRNLVNSKDGRFFITQVGREFLTYLSLAGRSLNRIG